MPDCKLSNGHKWAIAAIAGALYFIFSLRQSYEITDNISRKIGLPPLDMPGGPTMWGNFFHALVVFLIMRLLLEFF